MINVNLLYDTAENGFIKSLHREGFGLAWAGPTSNVVETQIELEDLGMFEGETPQLPGASHRTMRVRDDSLALESLASASSVFSRLFTGAKTGDFSRVLNLVTIGLWIAALALVLVPLAPHVLYRVFPDMTSRVAQVLGTTAEVDKSAFGSELYEAPRELPPFDPTLPEENRLIIPSIGVDTQIGEGEDWEEVLKSGPWRTPGFGTPEDASKPVILASHRFGYITWSREFRRENSFYNLPKLEVGDRFEVVWNQRKFVYEIYEGYTDDKIASYDADVILYTCEVLNSDMRIFRNARLVQG